MTWWEWLIVVAIVSGALFAMEYGELIINALFPRGPGGFGH